MRIRDFETTKQIFDQISWTNHKQLKVSYYSFGDEILEAVDADDRGYDMKMSFNAILSYFSLLHELLVYSRALFDTITAIHKAKESSLINTVSFMRNAFKSEYLDAFKWI